MLDRILELYVEQDQSAEAIIATGLDRDQVERVVRLVGFFYPEGVPTSRLSARDFVADPSEWEASRPSMPGVLRSHLDQMRRLVHSDRWLVSDCRRAFGCWPYSSFASELERLMGVLELHLTSEVAAWFGGRAGGARSVN